MNYWQERLIKSQEALEKRSVKQVEKQLKKYYAQAAERCINDFENVYDKLIATTDAGKQPTPADLYKLDKYWEAQAQMRQELRKLGDRKLSVLSKAFEIFWFDAYYSMEIPDIETQTFNTVDKAAVQQMINRIWCADGKSWSDRIWTSTELLATTLNDELIHCVATGKKTTDLKKMLMARFDVDYSRADTLVRTEIAHIQTEAAKKRYEDYGLQYYEILGNDDDSCGNHAVDCHDMDGKKFLYADMVPGKNAPPFHPNCKCAIIPVIE